MIKIVISEKGKKELDRLSFDIELALDKIIAYVPKVDLMGISHIHITDLAEKGNKHLQTARGAYYKKEDNSPAYIELYLMNLFRYVENPKSLETPMLPYQYIGIGYTIFHEIGHHTQTIRSHGIKKKRREGFADSYANKLIDKYVLENADSINSSFIYLEEQSENLKLSEEKMQKMKAGWEKQYQLAKRRFKND